MEYPNYIVGIPHLKMKNVQLTMQCCSSMSTTVHQIQMKTRLAIVASNQPTFAISQANFARYKASLGSSHKPTYSNEQLAKDFYSANETLKVRWQECNVSHAEKLVMAENHNKRMEPHSKTHLLKNLQRKMGFFQKKLEHLPLVLDVDTDSKRFAYIQDAESITKMLDAYINWKWDNQAIEYMGF